MALCYFINEQVEKEKEKCSPTVRRSWNGQWCMLTLPSSSMFYIMMIIRKSAKTSQMRYEVCRHVNATHEQFHAELDSFKQVEREDEYLANGAQSTYNTDTFLARAMRLDPESGLAYFHSTVRDMVKRHVEEEIKQGRQIWPARREVNSDQVAVICLYTLALLCPIPGPSRTQ